MADTAAAVADAADTFAYPVHVEDAGPATKRVTIEIPEARIKEKLSEQFREVRAQAMIPGFRPGKAPMSLIEKKFAAEIRDQVRRQLIGESYEYAITTHNLQVLGDPEFDNPAGLEKLPDSGDLKFTVIVEIQPQFTLPNLDGIEVKRPKIEVTDANVDQAMQNLREQQGQLVPVEDAARPRDFLFGDFHLKLDGQVIGHQHGGQIMVANGRIAGIDIPDLENKLVGIKPGETRTLDADVPANFPQPELAGKKVQIEIKVNEIKRLEPAVIDQDFLESLGFSSEKELRDALREQLVERIDYDVAEAMRNQVRKYLLDNTTMELPLKLTERQSNRVVQRRAINLMQRGMPQAQIEANLDAIRQGSIDEARAELKLFFILQKIAADREVEVDESELNGRIAMMAALRGERPEKLKQAMAKDGSLSQLYLQLREQKALDTILDKAKIEDVAVGQDLAKAAQAPSGGAASAG
ncbi:MAG: trigger factor [Tepidisphaerales bacterium]